MPELPEVETIRRALVASLRGRAVSGVEAHDVRLREGIDPEQWQALPGARLASIARRGKFLIADFGRLQALLHLGMSGRLLVTAPARARLPHTHLILGFGGDRELRLVDPRRFGLALLRPPPGIAAHPSLRALGVEPLSPDAGRVLVERARRSATPIRSLLLDQRVLAGIGNIYANEALARARIHPLRRADTISARRLRLLADALVRVLEEAIAAGGTTLADGGYVDSEGREGFFALRLAVYGRDGQPCPTCGTRIARRTAANRSVFYCPRCQR